MEYAVWLYRGDKGTGFGGKFIEEEDDDVSLRLIEECHRRDEKRLCDGRPSEELRGGSRGLSIQKAVRRSIEGERNAQCRITEIKRMLDANMQIVDAPRDRPAYDALRTSLHW